MKQMGIEQAFEVIRTWGTSPRMTREEMQAVRVLNQALRDERLTPVQRAEFSDFGVKNLVGE